MLSWVRDLVIRSVAEPQADKDDCWWLTVWERNALGACASGTNNSPRNSFNLSPSEHIDLQ